MRGIAATVFVVLVQGCSSPQLTVVVPEHPLWDKNPTQKDAAQSGKLSRGEVYPGSCAAFCQIDHPTSGSQLWVYSGGLAPYPIVGEERTVQFAVAMSTNYDANGAPTGAAIRKLAAGDKVFVVDDLGAVPKTLSCVIEEGKVAGYVSRRAVQPPAVTGAVALPSMAPATPPPPPCSERLAAFVPEGGDVISRAVLPSEPASKQTEKAPPHEIPCAATERDDDCRQVGVDYVFAKARGEDARVDYEVRDLPNGKQSVVVREIREKVAPARGAGIRFVWRPGNPAADPLPGAAERAGFSALELGARSSTGVRTYEVRCPLAPPAPPRAASAGATPGLAFELDLSKDPGPHCSKDEKVSVELTIADTADFEAVRLLSYKFKEESKEARGKSRSTFSLIDQWGGLPILLPAEVSGPCDEPHYGIGGFHLFLPDAKALAKPAPLEITYSATEAAPLEAATFAIYGWDAERLDWTYVGGKHDPATRTVSAMVKTLTTFTLAPAMPVGDIALTETRAKGIHNFRTAKLATNEGKPVKDGTLYTVLAYQPPTSLTSIRPGWSPFDTVIGEIVQPDADANEKGVQIAAKGGVLTFQLKLAQGPAKVVVYSVEGTALGVAEIP